MGEFRQQTRQKFMPCEAWQYNTRLIPARIYYMRIAFACVLPLRLRLADVRCRSLPGRAWPHARQASWHDHRRGRLGAGIRSRGTDDLPQRRAHARALDAPHTSGHLGAVDDDSFDVSLSDGTITATSRSMSMTRAAWST